MPFRWLITIQEYSTIQLDISMAGHIVYSFNKMPTNHSYMVIILSLMKQIPHPSSPKLYNKKKNAWASITFIEII